MLQRQQNTSEPTISENTILTFDAVKYTVGSVLGSGLTAKVFKATQLPNSVINDAETHVAIKNVRRKFIGGFQDEVNGLLQCGNHPNIVKLLGYIGGSEEDNLHLIALEYCESDLFSYVTKTGGLIEEQTRYCFAEQILPAMAHLHGKGICHRDLKLENLLLKGDQVKIADFTFAQVMKDSEGQDVLFQQQCGTQVYMAPEIQRGRRYKGAQVDVYSLGVCLFMMHMGQNPFSTAQFYHLLWKKPKWFWKQFSKKPSDEFKDLVQRMLDYNPDQRITLDEVTTHSWFSKDKVLTGK